MAQTVKLKRSNTAGTIPTTSNLALGEVAINTKDGKFFLRKHVDGSTGDAIHAYAPQGINAYGTQELVVKVVTKTTAHPNHGSGSSSGYTVQGLEGPFLALIPGNTYKFDVSDNSNSGHPFRFYLDAAKATAYTTGVTTSGSAGNSGAYVQIAVTTSTPQVLYYQCSSHSLMGSAAYVASDAIAANAVGSSQIAQNSITSSEIPDNSIGATQISAAVLAAKQDTLGNNSITAAMISQNTVGISELNVTDGSANQVLTTDGSGTLSFANPSSGTVTETFKTVSVSGQDDVVADGATDTLTLAAGSGMTITTNASSDTITFVSSASGIADDAVTTSKIADLNVTSAKLANNSVTAAKIATDAVGASEIAANSVGISELNVSDGDAGQFLQTDGSGTLSFATGGGGSVSEAFKTLAVSGQDNVVADSATDTLTFAAGSNMTITTNASNDTITFASSGSGGSSSSFAKNTFSGDGSTTAFTLTTSMSNEDGLIVFIDGVYQADNVYSVSNTTLTFATAPVNGRIIEVFQMEGGIVGTAPVLATMTGDGSDTTLALGTTPSSENQCFVTIDGVMQHKSTYSVSGSTLTFSTAPPNGTAVEAITLTNTSVATFQDSDGDTKIQMEESADEDKIRFDTAGSERMVIDSGGDVSIGSRGTNPMGLSITGTVLALSEASDVASLQIDGVTGTRIDMGTNSSRNAVFYTDANQLEISRTTNHPIVFKVNNSEIGRFVSTEFKLASGKKLVGGASSGSVDFTIQSEYRTVITGGANAKGTVLLQDTGTTYGLLERPTSTNDFDIQNPISDGDITFVGNDGGSSITPLTLDMSEAGKALFNSAIQVNPSSSFNLLIDTNSDGMQLKAKKDGTDDVDLTFQTQASGGTLAEKMRITGAGDVGIGTSAPAQLFEVHGAAKKSRFTRTGSAGTLIEIYSGGTMSGGIQSNAGGLGISGGSGENRMFLPTTAQAHVGIGTTDFPTGMASSSYAQLKVGGSLFSVSGEGNGSAAFLTNNAYVGSGNNMYLDAGGAASAIQQTQGKVTFMTFDGSGGSADSQWSMTNRMTVNGSGQVCFGTATALDSSNATCGFTPNSNTGAELIVGRPSSFTATGNTLLHYHNGSYIGGINTSTTQTSFLDGTSDLTLKENIQTWNENVLDSFKTLQPKTFNFIADEDNNTKKGFIAQNEVDKFPEAYPLTADNKYGFNPSGMVIYLMKAIQEQQVIIDDLKSRIETLEG